MTTEQYIAYWMNEFKQMPIQEVSDFAEYHERVLSDWQLGNTKLFDEDDWTLSEHEDILTAALNVLEAYDLKPTNIIQFPGRGDSE